MNSETLNELRDRTAQRVKAEYPGVDYLGIRIQSIFDEVVTELIKEGKIEESVR